ncbi:MAG: 30S ribosomal protein S6 [Candidatus Aminicenantia bacterium]
MRIYETGFLISPGLSEEETEEVIKKIVKIVKDKKGEVIDLEKWGRRKLAYPINHFEEAYYVFFCYQAPPNTPIELERQFRQKEAIIRYLTVKLDDKIMAERLKGKQAQEESLSQETSDSQETESREE